ncbi:MAG: hypothetical protein N4A54_13835 [Peptostreptococcaceae bacterium]|jgi:hypothetical protein|nr:hypothetical protein [Peptostreptococcaceae bacterium]
MGKTENEKEHEYLYRFTNISNLMDMLERKKLVLVHPSLWEDNYEHYFFNKITKDEKSFEEYKNIILEDPIKERLHYLNEDNAIEKIEDILNSFFDVLNFFSIEKNIDYMLSKENVKYKDDLDMLNIMINIKKDTLKSNLLRPKDIEILFEILNKKDSRNFIKKLKRKQLSQLNNKINDLNESSLYENNIYVYDKNSLQYKNLEKKIKNIYKKNTGDDREMSISLINDLLAFTKCISIIELKKLCNNSNYMILIILDNIKNNEKDIIEKIIEFYKYDSNYINSKYVYLVLTMIVLNGILNLLKKDFNNNLVVKLKNKLEKIKPNNIKMEKIIDDFFFLSNVYIRLILNFLNIKNAFYGQSWSFHEESDALWRIYSNSSDNATIKIKTLHNTEKLDNIKMLNNNNLTIGFHKIRYIDIFFKGEIAGIKDDDLSGKYLESLMTKRNAFEHEKESRIYASHEYSFNNLTWSYVKNYSKIEDWNYSYNFIKKMNENFNEEKNNILELDIEPTEFIESITVSPLAPPHIAKTIRAYIDNFNNREENRDKRNIEFEVSKLYKFE